MQQQSGEVEALGSDSVSVGSKSVGNSSVKRHGSVSTPVFKIDARDPFDDSTTTVKLMQASFFFLTFIIYHAFFPSVNLLKCIARK